MKCLYFDKQFLKLHLMTIYTISPDMDLFKPFMKKQSQKYRNPIRRAAGIAAGKEELCCVYYMQMKTLLLP